MRATIFVKCRAKICATWATFCARDFVLLRSLTNGMGCQALNHFILFFCVLYFVGFGGFGVVHFFVFAPRYFSARRECDCFCVMRGLELLPLWVTLTYQVHSFLWDFLVLSETLKQSWCRTEIVLVSDRIYRNKQTLFTLKDR